MKARFVFEKFSEKGDPIRDMGIGVMELIAITDSDDTWGKIRKLNHKETLTVLRNWENLATDDELIFHAKDGSFYFWKDLSGKEIFYKNKIYKIPVI